MSEWPKRYHPARPDGDGGQAVDDTVVVEGYQLQPGTWDSCAVWCGGVRILDPVTGDQALAVGSLDAAHIAQLGDFVMATEPGYVVDRADGHYQRWQPVPTDDPPTEES